MNVSRQTIISIERGRYIPSLFLALRIARFFGRSMDELFQLEEDRT
jgi:putative transcriptional regulator